MNSPLEVAIKALEEVSALRTSDNFGWMEAALRAREITTRALTTIRAARELPGAGTEDSNLGSAPDRKAGVPSGPSPAAVANQRESTTVAGEGSRQADHIASAAAGPGEAPCRKVCKTCEGSGRVLEARWGGRVGTKQCPDCATPTPSTRPGTEPAR